MAHTDLIHFAFSQIQKDSLGMLEALSKNEEIRINTFMTKKRTERSQCNPWTLIN